MATEDSTQKGGRVLALVDWFIPVELKAGAHDFSRARVMVSIAFVYAVTAFLCWLWIFLGSPFEMRYRVLATVLIAPLCFLYLIVPFVFRLLGHFYTLTNTLILSALVAIVLGVYVSGGPLESSVNYLILLPPFMSIFLIGFAGGVFWSALTLVAELSMMYAQLRGHVFPNLWDHRFFLQIEIISWTVSFFSAMGAALIYERIYRRLNRMLQLQKQEYQFLATHDGLTRIPNRTLFDDRLERAIHQAERGGRLFALLFIDLDGFKPVNDTYGHAAGDKTLVEVARRLSELVRKADTVARLGGDEFAMLLLDIGRDNDVERVAQAVLSALSEPIPLNGQSASISASVGVALCPRHGRSPAELKRRADMAMYRAKRRKNSYCIFDDSMERMLGESVA